MTTPTQGYVTLAYGPRKFFEMAVNVALSVKLNDPERPITLLYRDTETVSDDIAAHFDRCVPIPDAAAYPGLTIKLAIYDPSPYDETFYLDADCLIMKRDMDRHWHRYAVQDFALAGEKRTSGTVFGCDVHEMMAAANTDHIVDANCGLFFYRKSDTAARVFDDACAFMKAGSPALIETRLKRGDGVSDQPYFAAAMAKNAIEPVSYTAEEGTIMATTWRAADINFDMASGTARLKKPTGYWLMDRFFAKGWVQHDTSIAHFIDMQPLGLYQRQSDWLRDHFAVERFRFV